MNTRELYELASLDALGLLDEEERRDFEAAFASASPEMQAQIRREQLRFADQADFLPDVEPPADLRAKVLRAVREAISGVSSEPASVLASIGDTRSNRLLAQAPFWRAACIAFATASAVLATFVVRVNNQWDQTANMVESSAAYQHMVDEFSPRLINVLFADDMERISFVPTAPDADSVLPQAQLIYDSENKSGFIMLRNLPEIQGEYTIRFPDAEGNIVSSTPFVNTGGVVPVRIEAVDGMSFQSCEVASPRGAGGQSRVILRAADL